MHKWFNFKKKNFYDRQCYSLQSVSLDRLIPDHYGLHDTFKCTWEIRWLVWWPRKRKNTFTVMLTSCKETRGSALLRPRVCSQAPEKYLSVWEEESSRSASETSRCFIFSHSLTSPVLVLHHAPVKLVLWTADRKHWPRRKQNWGEDEAHQRDSLALHVWSGGFYLLNPPPTSQRKKQNDFGCR